MRFKLWKAYIYVSVSLIASRFFSAAFPTSEAFTATQAKEEKVMRERNEEEASSSGSHAGNRATDRLGVRKVAKKYFKTYTANDFDRLGLSMPSLRNFCDQVSLRVIEPRCPEGARANRDTYLANSR